MRRIVDPTHTVRSESMRTVLLCVVSLLLATAPLQGQDQPIAFEGATLHPVAGPTVDNGVLVVADGAIVAVGAAGEVDIPADAERRDAGGKVIIPGLVDTHSHIGRQQGGDGSSPTHPEVRTLDAIDVRDNSMMRARAGGITSVNIMSGSGHLLSGQTTYLKLRHGDVINDLLFCDNPTTDICGGIKMANGTNSIRQPPFPGTRAKSAALQRELFVNAEAYREEMENGTASRDLANEALVEVLDGERIVHFHTHTHEDILTILRMREEFGFNVVLHHVSEAWKVADEIAAAGVPSSLILLDSPGGKLEATNIRWENGRALAERGADVAFHTDDLVTDSRLFLRMAAFGVRAGMDEDAALEALTLAGARMLGLEAQVGSLEPGKDADFVVLSGPPFSVYSLVEETWIEGQPVFDRSDPDDAKFATGGMGTYEHASGHVHGQD